MTAKETTRVVSKMRNSVCIQKSYKVEMYNMRMLNVSVNFINYTFVCLVFFLNSILKFNTIYFFKLFM